jgi:hypothetical protein
MSKTIQELQVRQIPSRQNLYTPSFMAELHYSNTRIVLRDSVLPQRPTLEQEERRIGSHTMKHARLKTIRCLQDYRNVEKARVLATVVFMTNAEDPRHSHATPCNVLGTELRADTTLGLHTFFRLHTYYACGLLCRISVRQSLGIQRSLVSVVAVLHKCWSSVTRPKWSV